jgi:hypothetical protein
MEVWANGECYVEQGHRRFPEIALPEREYVRETISRRAKRAILNLRRGAVKRGTVEDLYKDLELDD